MDKALSVDLHIDGEMVFSVFNRCHNEEEVDKFISSVVAAITYKVKNTTEFKDDNKIYVDRDHYEKLERHWNGSVID